MKKLALSLLAVVATAVSSLAADLTEVWSQIKGTDSYIVVDTPEAQAKQEGFETMTVALNTAPTEQQILSAKELFATITPSQKLTSVSQMGVDVSIYSSLASADGTLYNVMFFISKSGGEDKALIVIYGKCTPDAMAKALKDLSIENIIGS